MAYGVVHTFAGGTEDQYKVSVAAVHPKEGLPEGQIFHVAGPSANGWTIMAIFDTKESWERFLDGVLIPHLQQGHEGGFPAPADEIAFEIYNQQP